MMNFQRKFWCRRSYAELCAKILAQVPSYPELVDAIMRFSQHDLTLGHK